MQRGAGPDEEVAAARQVESVVGVAAVRGAAAGRDQSCVAQLAEVVRDQVLGLAGERGQLADPAVAAGELPQQEPPLRIGDELEESVADADEAQETAASTIELGEQRYVEMSAAEQFILTVSERGYGKRSSSYEYRITNRGGKGLVAMAIWEGKKGSETIKEKIGPLVASFPVEEADQLMLVTDGGQLIRCPVDGIRIAGRSTQGVIVFNTADDEKVVSVERIGEEGEAENGC